MAKFLITLILSAIAIVILVGVFSVTFKIGKTSHKIPQTSDSKNPAPQESKSRVGQSPNFSLALPNGYSIGVFSDNTPGVRDLQVSPGGTLLASIFLRGKVIALPDKDYDGNADSVKEIIKGLDNPHGIAFYKGKLFVAEENKVSRYSWNEKDLTAEFERKLFNLPTGGRHNSRSLVFDSKGNMYVSLGSTCDTCVEKEAFISTVLISNADGATQEFIQRACATQSF